MKNLRIMPLALKSSAYFNTPSFQPPFKGELESTRGAVNIAPHSHRRALAILFIILPLAACTTLGSPNVRTIGPEIFALQETMPRNAKEAKAMRISLIKEAKAFCAKRGQSVEISNEDVLDATSRVYQVTFQCPQGLPEDTGVGALTFPKPIAVNPKASTTQPKLQTPDGF